MIAVQPQVQELWIKAQNKECITKGTRKNTEEQAERKKKREKIPERYSCEKSAKMLVFWKEVLDMPAGGLNLIGDARPAQISNNKADLSKRIQQLLLGIIFV